MWYVLPNELSAVITQDFEKTVAIYNGGLPGIMYEFIAASFFYWIIAASIAELSSAIPSSGGGSFPLRCDSRRIDTDHRIQYITGRPSQLVNMGDHAGGLLAGGIAWHGSSA